MTPVGSSPTPAPTAALPTLDFDAPRYTFDSQKRSNPNVNDRFKSPSPVRVGSPAAQQFTRAKVNRIAIISNSNKKGHLSLGRASITQPSQPKAPSPLIRQIRHETPMNKLTPRHQRDTVSWRAYKKSRRNVNLQMSPRRTFQAGLDKLKQEQSEWKELESKHQTISFGESPEKEKVFGLDGTVDTKPSSLELSGNLTPSLRVAQHTSRIIFPKIKQQHSMKQQKKKEQDIQTEKQSLQQGRKLSAQNYSTLGTQKNVEKFQHYTRMATQPYYYNKKGEIKSNEFSLQNHKPSCRLSLAESIDQLEQVESGQILPREAGSMSQTMKQHSVSPRGEKLMSSLDRRVQYNTERGVGASYLVHGSSVFPQKSRRVFKNQYEYVESKLKRLSLFPSDSRAKFQRFLNEDLEFASPKPRDARSSLYIDSHTSLMKRRYPGRQSGIHNQNLSLDHAPSFVINQRFVTVILNGPNPTSASLNRTVVLLKLSRPFDSKRGGPGNSSLLHKQREFRQFMVQCTKLLGLNRLLKHIFLPSGQQVYSLEEIPETAQKIYVSHLAYFFSGMASPRPVKKEEIQNKITNLQKAKLIQGASHRKVTQLQTPSLEQIQPLTSQIRQEDAQQTSNLSLMIRDLVSRQKRDIGQAEELYTKKRNIREIIKKSSNDAQLQYELRSIQDQEEIRSTHGSPTIFSRQSQNRDQQAQTVDEESGEIISSVPKQTALSITTSEVYYPQVKRKTGDNKFAQYIQSQSQKSSSVHGSKGVASTSMRLGSNYSRKYQTDLSEDQYENEFQDPLFDRELYNSRNRHKSVRNDVIRQEFTQEEMLEQMYKESMSRQQILSSAFNSIRLKLEVNREKQEREVIMRTAQNVGNILSRNHNTLTVSNGSEWLASMIERIERGDRVMDMLSDAKSSDTEEENSMDKSPVRHSLIANAKALRKVLDDYKNEVQFKIEPHLLEKQPSEEVKDFIQINKDKFNQTSRAHAVENRIGSIVTQNIPKLQLRSNFSRRQLHALHSQFKTLCKISLARHPEIIKKVQQNELAIDIQTFISCARGIMNFGFHQDETLARIFHAFDSDQNGVMDWEEFLLTMKLMTNNKMEQRVGLFFKAAEATYGSTLDFDATKKLCQQSLGRYMKIKSKDPIMEDLTLFFTNYIFQALGYEKTTQVPLKTIQETILNRADEQDDDLRDMLLLFSCSDD